MSKAGLLIFDEKGQCILDSSARVLKEIGSITCTYERKNQSMIDPRIIGKDVCFWVKDIKIIEAGNSMGRAVPSTIEADNKTGEIKWTYTLTGLDGYGIKYTKANTVIGYGWY